MLSLNIAIFDKDITYAQALTRYLMSTKRQQFCINLFSTESQLLDFLQSNSLDILLISDSFYPLIKLQKNIEVIILLIEETINTQLLELPYICKYQKGEVIVHQLITYYTSKSEKEILENTKAKPYLIGTYSPTGGSGKTTISMGIAQSLATQGCSTLFISLESIPSYTQLLDSDNKSSISDLFYYFRLKTENMLMKLEGIRGFDECSNLFYLPPPLHPNDMVSFSDEDWVSLINLLIKKGHYEYIILDFTSDFSMRNCQLLNLCHKKLYLINPILKSKSQFMYLMNLNHSYTNLEDFMFIVNHQQANKIIPIIDKIKIDFEVPYIESSNESHIKLTNDVQFTNCIKKLLEVIFKDE